MIDSCSSCLCNQKFHNVPFLCCLQPLLCTHTHTHTHTHHTHTHTLTHTHTYTHSLVGMETKTKDDGVDYYEYELNQLDASNGPHVVAQVTSKVGGVSTLLRPFILSPRTPGAPKQFPSPQKVSWFYSNCLRNNAEQTHQTARKEQCKEDRRETHTYTLSITGCFAPNVRRVKCCTCS